MAEFTPTCLLVTGGAGFIGSNLVRWLLSRAPNLTVVNYDVLTYAGNVESLADVEERYGVHGEDRYFFVRGDITDLEVLSAVLRGEAREAVAGNGRRRTVPPPDAVVHLAAESHVDRSIMSPAGFVKTNVQGTFALLQACMAILEATAKPFRFLHVSTDEVYGSLGPESPPFTEETPLRPSNPYSASKASSDHLVRAFVCTYGFPGIITRSSNNYGPYQFPEKLIPLVITRGLRDEAVPVYGDGLNVRDWVFVDDHAEALWAALTRGRVGEVYNIGGEDEVRNIDIVRTTLALLGKPESLIRYVPDRLGHDRRYGMSIRKVRGELEWQPRHRFLRGLRKTVDWYCENRTWWERVLNEAYRMSAVYLSHQLPENARRGTTVREREEALCVGP
jgi:dTDP-glucose 4,6-dehydratase